MKDRYGYQGELEIELTEKIKIGIDHIKESNKRVFAADLFDLISLAMNNDQLSQKERWELINSRAGQYLNNYVSKDEIFPDHVMKELTLIRS